MGFLWRYKWTWTEIEKVDMAELERFVLTYLADDGIWRLRRENDGAKLYTSVIQPYGTQYVRRILEVPAGLEQVRGFLVDEFTDHLTQMDVTIEESHSVDRFAPARDEVVFISHIYAKTLPIMNKREFLYFDRYRRIDDNHFILVSQSMDRADRPVRPGYTRGLMYPHGSLVTRLPSGGTRIESLSNEDICGWVPRWVYNRILYGMALPLHWKKAEYYQQRFAGLQEPASSTSAPGAGQTIARSSSALASQRLD